MRALLVLMSASALYGQMAEGNIVDAITGAPVPAALLSIAGQRGAPEVRSDLGGHFQISTVDSRASRLIIERPGYIPSSYVLPPASSPEFLSFRIRLQPQAVITGRVEDEDGFPVASGFVSAATYNVVSGGGVLRNLGAATVNEQGEYRISGLPAGRYLVHLVNVWKLADWDLRYSPEFYGGTLTPEGAAPIDVKAGEVRSGIDFHLTRREGVRIAVRLTSPAGWGRPDRISIWTHNDFSINRNAVAQPDGTRLLAHVPSGSYTLTGSAWFASLGRQVGVDRPLEVPASGVPDIAVNLELSTGVEMSGFILSDGVAPQCTYAIGLAKDTIPSYKARSQPDGTFSIAGVPPGHYHLAIQPDVAGERSTACRTITVSARLADTDVLHGLEVGIVSEGPLRIEVTRKVAVVTGNLIDSAAKPARAQLIFERLADNRLFSTYTELSGEFEKLLLPGSYYVYAAQTPEQSNALSDPVYRAQHHNDLPILQVVEGDNSPIHLTIPK
jgi:hypothetical protein